MKGVVIRSDHPNVISGETYNVVLQESKPGIVDGYALSVPAGTMNPTTKKPQGSLTVFEPLENVRIID